MVNETRNKVALKILCALVSNSERYKYIAEKVENNELNQHDANMKNINKAFRMADAFIIRSQKQ